MMLPATYKGVLILQEPLVCQPHASCWSCTDDVAALKPSLRVCRGLSTYNVPGYLGFLQFLRNFRQLNACEQAEIVIQAA